MTFELGRLRILLELRQLFAYEGKINIFKGMYDTRN